jgi:hypothetical protein
MQKKKFDWARNTDEPEFGFRPDVDPAFDKLVVPVSVPRRPVPVRPPVINPNYTPLPSVVSAPSQPPRPPSLFASLALVQPMQVVDEKEEEDDDDDDDTDLLRDLDLVVIPEKTQQDIAWANRFDIMVQLGRLDGQDMYAFACHPDNSSIEEKHLMVLQKMFCVMREDLFRVVTCPLITPDRDSVRFPARFWSLVSGFAWQISRVLSSTPSRFLRTTGPQVSLARIQEQMQNTYSSRHDSLTDHPLALTRLLVVAHWLISPAQLQDVILDARQRCRLANPLMWAVLPDDQKPDPAFLVLFRVIVGPMLYTAMNSAAFEPPIPKAAMDEVTTKLDLKSWPLENNVLEQHADGSLSRVSLFGPTMLNKSAGETREWFWRLLLLHQFCPPL